MLAVAIKTFDAMEAPEWSGLRPKPPIEIDPYLLEAPPVPPEFLHPTKFVVPQAPANTPTLTLAPTAPAPTLPKPLIPKYQKPATNDDVEYTDEEESWFEEDAFFQNDVPPSQAERIKRGPRRWLFLLVGTTLLAGVGSSIAWVLFQNL